MEILRHLVEWVVAWAESPYGPAALFVISFAESSFFPVPPDVLLIALSIANPPTALVFALVCMIGSVLGGMLGHQIGRRGGRPVAIKLFGEEKIMLVQRLYQRYDVWAILIAAFTPIPYKVFSISAGVFELDFGRFVIASAIGRGARFFLVGGLIFAFGETIQYYLSQYFELAVTLFAVLFVAGFLLIHASARVIRRRERARNAVDSSASQQAKPN